MGVVFCWFIALCTGIPGLVFLGVGADRYFDKKRDEATDLLAIGLVLLIIALYFVVGSIQFFNACQTTNSPGCG